MNFFCIFYLINFWSEYINYSRKCDGSLAQLEEHLVYTERVGSSNLSTPTNQTAFRGGFFIGAELPIWAA